MKLTERRRLCQHCGKHRATWSLTWRWEDDTIDEEDWCDACFQYADNVSSAARLWVPAGSPEICRA